MRLLGFCCYILDFSRLVMGVGRGPIGLVAVLRFKTLDSQPGNCHMSRVSTDFHVSCCVFRNLHVASEPDVHHIFGLSSQIRFSVTPVWNEKMCEQKTCRFVVVSPREVHFSLGFGHFEFSGFRPPLRVLWYVMIL